METWEKLSRPDFEKPAVHVTKGNICIRPGCLRFLFYASPIPFRHHSWRFFSLCGILALPLSKDFPCSQRRQIRTSNEFSTPLRFSFFLHPAFFYHVFYSNQINRPRVVFDFYPYVALSKPDLRRSRSARHLHAFLPQTSPCESSPHESSVND